jgi:hypothetical protein
VAERQKGSVGDGEVHRTLVPRGVAVTVGAGVGVLAWSLWMS